MVLDSWTSAGHIISEGMLLMDLGQYNIFLWHDVQTRVDIRVKIWNTAAGALMECKARLELFSLVGDLSVVGEKKLHTLSHSLSHHTHTCTYKNTRAHIHTQLLLDMQSAVAPAAVLRLAYKWRDEREKGSKSDWVQKWVIFSRHGAAIDYTEIILHGATQQLLKDKIL